MLSIIGIMKSTQRYSADTQIIDAAEYWRPMIIYITNAVAYSLQREVFRLKHDSTAGVF
jgi:hypothetical protein